MLRMKALEEKGLTVSPLIWLTALWLCYLSISWGCEQEPESLRLDFKNEARTMSGQYLQSAS